jgi:predicted ArsR family transcriptional regulator
LLTIEVLREMTECLPPEEMDRALERIAERMARQASIPRDSDFSTQVEATVQFLNTLGFMATVEEVDNRFILHIANCPYERVSRHRSEPCAIDTALLSQLLGDEVVDIEQDADPTGHCTYVFSTD